jgi:hypothetical protein
MIAAGKRAGRPSRLSAIRAREQTMELVILIFRLVVWVTVEGSGAGPHGEDGGADCARGGIVPC